MYRIDLNYDWLVTHEELSWGPERAAEILHKKGGWLAADIPCDVHMPLIKEGIIKEPLEADNCFDCEWIEDKSWWFKKVFHIDDEILKNDIVELTLESLDSEADVFINGTHIGHQKSVFYPFTANIKKFVSEGENILLVRMTTGVEYISEYDMAGLKKYISTESDGRRGNRGDKRRAFVRKPQYVFGWDWGPRVATCGIMKPVYIKAYKGIAIKNVYPVTKAVNEDASIQFKVEIENLDPISTVSAVVKIDVEYDEHAVLSVEKEALLRSGINYLDFDGIIADAKLWWPNGMGEQPLYTLKVSAQSCYGDSDKYPPFKFAIRTVKLNLDKIDHEGRKFAFEINGVTAFCKGGNWIPADSIYARVTDQKYDTLISEAREANFNMLRIWGGGIYERDIFYDKCDQYGIMIWHDFMFSCALYSDNLDWFRYEVQKEIDYQTKRLRHHPSIVLWCGNNENQWIYENWWRQSEHSILPGGIICYNQIAPQIIHNNCPEIPYWNSSPYGGRHPNDNDAGDRHHWNDCTMNEDMQKRITPEEYDKIESKFISEYGYIGPCRKSSILQYHAGMPLNRSGDIWKLHNNTFEKETVPAGIKKHYKDPDSLNIDEYLLYAGLCQGLMLNYSLEAIRYIKNCYGSLFWMYNDCWGEVGWTIIDYYLRRKPSFYFVKRAFAPIKLIMRQDNDMVKVVGINDTPGHIHFNADYGYISFDGREKDLRNTRLDLLPFSKTIVLEFKKEDHVTNRGIWCIIPQNSEPWITPAILRPGDFRQLQISKADLKITDFKSNGKDASFKVSTDVFAHAVHFDLGDDIRLSDEHFDLLPGEDRIVTVFDVYDSLDIHNINAKCIYNL